MTKEQYKNIISMTVNDVKKENVLNSVELTRTIMGNCGVAFPNGSLAEVTSTLATDEYMGWRECSETQATEYANEGIPVIRVDNTGVSVIAPDDGNDAELTVNSTATFNSNTSVQASNSDESQYYAYYANTTTTTQDSFEILGIPDSDVEIHTSFTLCGSNNLDMTVDVIWDYDDSKFEITTEFKYHNFYTTFTAIETGNTIIRAYYGGMVRIIPITIINPQIAFNANGGSVSQTTIDVAYGSYITLPAPTHDNDHIFMGWFNSAEDTHKIGDAGDQYLVDGSATLYAQWLFLKKRILTKNACYIYNSSKTHKDGVRGIMVHSTAANNSSLGRYVPREAYDDYAEDTLLSENIYNNHWNQAYPDGIAVCVHAFVGKTSDGRVAVYQTLPWETPGWHSGNYANTNAINNSADDMGYIGFEICEDQTDDAYLKDAYLEAVKLCVYLCKTYGTTIFYNDNITIDSAIVSHYEGNTIHHFASAHGDPDHWFNPKGYTMAGFRQDVINMLGN